MSRASQFANKLDLSQSLPVFVIPTCFQSIHFWSIFTIPQCCAVNIITVNNPHALHRQRSPTHISLVTLNTILLAHTKQKVLVFYLHDDFESGSGISLGLSVVTSCSRITKVRGLQHVMINKICPRKDMSCL